MYFPARSQFNLWTNAIWQRCCKRAISAAPKLSTRHEFRGAPEGDSTGSTRWAVAEEVRGERNTNGDSQKNTAMSLADFVYCATLVVNSCLKSNRIEELLYVRPIFTGYVVGADMPAALERLEFCACDLSKFLGSAVGHVRVILGMEH
jgi:hypothetical protein